MSLWLYPLVAFVVGGLTGILFIKSFIEENKVKRFIPSFLFGLSLGLFAFVPKGAVTTIIVSWVISFVLGVLLALFMKIFGSLYVRIYEDMKRENKTK